MVRLLWTAEAWLQQSEPVFQLSLGIAGTYRLAHQRTIVTLHPQAPRLRGGDRGYGLGTRAAGPPGAERLLTAGRIIGLLKYPLELGKIRRGQAWIINNQ